ncbi:putative membrane protein [Scopulibacillus daqui]|uniref:Membrane protein n=1 Tax=Scopulibacillus daqui TaxID=1469162 RepID=A0ABS2Q347_9BACL|nr:putative membrane protein [Scopulibacillus daqui]
MAVGIIFLLIAILCLIGAIRAFKSRNFFGAGYAVITLAVFGWFSIMTIIDVLNGGGVQVGS